MNYPEEILASEVDWFHFATDVTLVCMLDFKVEKRKTEDGPPPDDLEAPGEPEYYICTARNLLLDEDHNFQVEVLILLYGAEHLKGCGQGPQAVPDSFTWGQEGCYTVDLSQDLEDAVLEALLADMEQSNESLLKHIAFKEDPEAYIRTIKDERLLSKLLPYWESNKEYWI